MSQLTHPSARLRAPIKSPRLIALAALLALVATTAVVLVLAIGGSDSTSPTADLPQQPVRADGGPEETGVAAAIASQPAVAAPEESKIAANLTSPGLARQAREAAGQAASSRPDESAVAAAISGR